jgi:CheY-like chemotaxis protein
MPHGGTLTIATALRGEQVELRVADTGIGMDEATRASAFEPFFTTKGDRGTGLGLAVVQNIVGDAGATVTCASAPGQGTSFVFTFPASEVTPMPRPSDLPAANATQRRIVFVDDNTLLRGVVVRALRRAGFLVDAFDGANDVDAIDARLEGADALITDLVMPGRSGVDLALELRRRKRPMPILFVSGYAEHELLERVRDVPRSSVLEKPFTAQDVIDRLGKLQQS